MLDILDTAGEEFIVRNNILKQEKDFIYSITSRSSFGYVPQQYHQVIQFSNLNPMILVGNKCDLERERKNSKEHGEELWILRNSCARKNHTY